MNLWQKLTIDWPCALGDWLWVALVVAPAAFLDRLSFKRVVLLAVLLLAVITFAQIVTIDVAFIWAGDMTVYFDIASAVILIAARGHARQVFRTIERQVREAARVTSDIARQYRIRGRQRRNAAATERNSASEKPAQSDDDAGAWRGGLYALA